jgi:hypothetical protein
MKERKRSSALILFFFNRIATKIPLTVEVSIHLRPLNLSHSCRKVTQADSVMSETETGQEREIEYHVEKKGW